MRARSTQRTLRRRSDRWQSLIDAETDAHIWADRFDTDRMNLAKAQAEITGRLARSLQLELMEAVGRRIERDKPENLDARDLIMRGWAFYNRPHNCTLICTCSPSRRTLPSST